MGRKDTVIEPCGSPADGSYVTAECVRGTISMAGSPTGSMPCSEPVEGDGRYVSAFCKRGSPFGALETTLS